MSTGRQGKNVTSQVFTKEDDMRKRGMVLVRIFLVVFILSGLFLLSPQPSSAAKPEGTLKVALFSFAEEGFLPSIGLSQQADLWDLVYDYLIYTDMKTRKPIPGLAKKWEYSKDFRDLTLYLREGVPWQEGYGTVTAEDVKFTIDLIMRDGSTNIQTPYFRDCVESVKVVNPTTVAIRLKEPNSMFWYQFTATTGYALPIVCKKYVETVGDQKAFEKPVGSGPYRLVDHKLGEYLKFEALDQHWRLVPEFKTIIMRPMPEETTRIAMMKTGELDIAEISAENVATLKAAGIKTAAWTGDYIAVLHFGGMYIPEDKGFKKDVHRKDPWADKRVREAMNIAIDRKAIIKSFYFGTAKPAEISWLVPGYETRKPIPYDPQKAKKLLAEAGYPNGFSFKVAAVVQSPGAELPKVAQAVAGYWEKIGLNVTIETNDWPTWKKKLMARQDAGYIWVRRNPYYDDFYAKVRDKHYPNGPYTIYQDEKLSALIDRVGNETDFKKMSAVWREFTKYACDNYVELPIASAGRIWAYSKEVGEWPKNVSSWPRNYAYIRHAKPLNTFRLFNP
jgi:peptide/nickel transport system substrate-binding protein